MIKMEMRLLVVKEVIMVFQGNYAAAAAAKLLHSCPTQYDPIDGSPPGSTIPGSIAGSY